MREKTEKEKMLAGEFYRATDSLLVQEHRASNKLCRQYNATTDDQPEVRSQILSKLLGTCHTDTFIEPNFKCDYGYNTHLGQKFYANYDLIILDVCEVRIGNNCMIGPRVSLFTATHPTDAATRVAGLEFGKPISIGDNVWIGGQSVINPGVSLGDNVVVASGSVVTKSFGSNLLIGGVPAKVIRTIA